MDKSVLIMESRKSNAFQPISDALMIQMRQILGEQYLSTDETVRLNNGHDETEDFVFLPEVVAFPETTEQISALMRLCNEAIVPVTVRGGGSGLAGGALPVEGGLVISMKRMDKIIQIDERNFQVTVEPGIITEHLQNILKIRGCFIP